MVHNSLSKRGSRLRAPRAFVFKCSAWQGGALLFNKLEISPETSFAFRTRNLNARSAARTHDVCLSQWSCRKTLPRTS
eukprot:2595163-Pyramimonas_sp.AAC.1